tara:strand:+ start:46 stop:1335 length:1290 start_codon:yes stop_codon:yes gene_type:complete
VQLSDSLKARYLCLQILTGVFKKRKSVSHILESQRVSVSFYKDSDVAIAKRLSDFIFLHLNSVDYCIDLYVKKNIKLEVRNILRLVVAEYVNKGCPDYAIVNSAVKLAKLNKASSFFSGLVNAIARKLVLNLRKNELVFKPELQANFRINLRKYYTEDVIQKLEKLITKRAPIDITISDKKDINFFRKQLNAIELPTGTLRLENSKGFAQLNGFRTGKWWVQGVSSSIPVKLLGNIYGLEVLDLFSAPGGKAMQLISAGARVTCLDLSLKRIETLKQNLCRMNMEAEIIQANIERFRTEKKYDIIVIDVPCSSSGTFRKNKDLLHLNPTERVYSLKKIQAYTLEAAKAWIKDNGTILYCACSLFPEEGENQTKRFLINNEDWMQKVICPAKFDLEGDWVDKHGGLRLRPDHLFDFGGMDGFYASLLIKK